MRLWMMMMRLWAIERSFDSVMVVCMRVLIEIQLTYGFEGLSSISIRFCSLLGR